MISPVRFGAQPALSNEQFAKLQARFQDAPVDIKLDILKLISADRWESAINKALSGDLDILTGEAITKALSDLHLVTAYRGQDYFKKTANQSTALIESIKKDKPIVFNWFMKLPVSEDSCLKLLNQTNQAGVSALHMAILKDRFQTAKELMAKGAKPTLQDAYLAAYHGKRAFLESTLLPALGLAANVDKMEVDGEEEPNQQRNELLALAQTQQTEIARLKRLTQEQKNTALTARMQAGNLTLASLLSLIRAGADINSQEEHMGKTALYLAVESDQHEIVDQLLAHGANVDVRDAIGNTVLHSAITNNQVDQVKKLLTYGPDLSLLKHSRTQENYLHLALASGEQEIIKAIIDQKPTLITNNTTPFGKTPLRIAIDTGNVDAVRAMIAKRPDILDTRDQFGEGLLFLAAAGNNAVLEALLPEHFDHSGLLDKAKNTLLHRAARSGNAENVELLLSRDPSGIWQTNNDKRTPLHEAAQSGNVNAVQAILAHHPKNTRQFDISDRTPLHFAFHSPGAVEVSTALLNHDPELINLRNDNQQNLLHLLASSGKQGPLINLIHQKAPHFIWEKDVHGKTPLHLAVENNNRPDVESLVNLNSRLTEIADEQGDLPIHTSLYKYNDNLTSLLVKQNPKTLKITNSQGETPLYLAVKHRQAKLIPELIQAGADIDQAESKQGKTLLHLALEDKNFNLVKALLKYKPSLDIRDHSGKTILERAKEQQVTAEQELLQLKNEKVSDSSRGRYLWDYTDPFQGHLKKIELAESELQDLNSMIKTLLAYQESASSKRVFHTSNSSASLCRSSTSSSSSDLIGKLHQSLSQTSFPKPMRMGWSR